MPTVALSPLFNGWQGFTSSGIPLNAGKIYTYISGGTTPQATYTTSAGSVQNANPIILGADGRPPNEIWLIQAGYRFDLKDSADNLIDTYDTIPGYNGLSTTPSGTLSWGSGTASYGQVTKYKAASQTIANSTTIVDDPYLFFSIGANEVWVALLEIDAGANLATTGIQVQVTVPSAATLSFKPSVQPDVIATTGTYARVTGTSGATLDFGTTNLPGAGEVVIRAIIYVANSTNAGSVKFRWGPSTNTGTALSLRAGSSLFARRVA